MAISNVFMHDVISVTADEDSLRIILDDGGSAYAFMAAGKAKAMADAYNAPAFADGETQDQIEEANAAMYAADLAGA